MYLSTSKLDFSMHIYSVVTEKARWDDLRTLDSNIVSPGTPNVTKLPWGRETPFQHSMYLWTCAPQLTGLASWSLCTVAQLHCFANAPLHFWQGSQGTCLGNILASDAPLNRVSLRLTQKFRYGIVTGKCAMSDWLLLTRTTFRILTILNSKSAQV